MSAMAWLRVLVSALACSCALGATCVYNSDYSTVARNPFRGFMSPVGPKSNFPTSLEFKEFVMSELMFGPGAFDFSPITDMLEEVSSRGNHGIFRVTVDSPSKGVVGVPPFLLAGAGSVSMTSYTVNGGGRYPDFDNQRLLAAFEDLISNLGKEFDMDPRLAGVQVGLIGFRGNWHMHPIDIGLPTRQNQLRVLAAFAQAFNHTPVLVADNELDQWSVADMATDRTTRWRIGWYDSDFGLYTYLADIVSRPQDYLEFFEPMLRRHQASTKYEEIVIGGEVSASLQVTAFDTQDLADEFDRSVAATHASWLLNEHLFSSKSPYLQNFGIRARKTATRMGYAPFLSTASIDVLPCANQPARFCATVRMTFENIGNAPSPFSVKVRVHLTVKKLSTSHLLVGTDISKLMPGTTVSVNPPPFELLLMPNLDLSDFTVRVTLEGDRHLRPMNFANAKSKEGLDLFAQGKCVEPNAADDETLSPHDTLVGPGATAAVVIGGTGLFGVALAAWWRSIRNSKKAVPSDRKKELDRIWGGKKATKVTPLE